MTHNETRKTAIDIPHPETPHPEGPHLEKPRARRLATVAAALALAGVLGGCVVYPAGPGWGYHDHWHDRGDWR